MASTSERPAVAATLVRPPAIAGPRTTHPLAYVMGEIDLVRALRLGDIPTVVVAGRRSPSRYARGPVAVLEPPDVKRAPEAAVDRLLGYAAGQAEPPVVFYDNDPALMLVSRARDRLRERLRFLMPAAELVEDLVDKGRFQALAEQLGLPVPRAVRMTSHDVRLDHGLRYPLIVKPLTRHDGPWESLEAGKAVPIADARALTGIGERLQGTDLQLLVQESVPGAEDRIESYHVYVDERGAVAGEFTGRKVRTAPTAYGYSTAVTITDSPPVKQLGRAVTSRLELRGVAKLDFKRDEDGSYKLLEINPRYSLWHHPGAVAGVNLPALVYADLTGRRRPEVKPVRPGVCWCSPHDIHAARAHGVPMSEWLRWVARCDVVSGFSRDDPLPVLRAGMWRVRRRVGARFVTARSRAVTAATSPSPRDRPV